MIYGIAIAVGFVAEFVRPIPIFSRTVGLWFGAILITLSIPIVVSAFKALARMHTTFDARKSTTKIAMEGAFRYSRNPTYLSLTMLHIGIAFVFNSFWVMLMALPAVVVIHWVVILREEQYLKVKFGEEYLSYAKKVRRWI